MARRFLFWFAHEHLNFRDAEISSLCNMFNLNMKFVETPSVDTLYWIVEFNSIECALKIASRSVSLRWCLELWSRAKCVDRLHETIQYSLTKNNKDWSSEVFKSCEKTYVCPKSIMEPYLKSQKSFKISVETFNKHISSIEKIQKIENFSYLPLCGPVILKNPDIDLMFLEFYGSDVKNIPLKPYDVFFGRRIAEGQRHLISKLSLKNRTFIGNTSMDPQLSLFMANQAQITSGNIVLDPFVGSGSLLVAASVFGGYVWGSDIDFLTVHGRSRPTRVKQKIRQENESVKANMYQYETQNQYLDIIVSDFSKQLWKDSLKFDAIITDPPYGIREATEKIGIERENYILSPEHLANHIPSKIDYNLSQLYKDLLSFSAVHLHNEKRLVCWFPYFRNDYSEEIIPSHECLLLVANSEQILSKTTARRLLTYKKIKEFPC